MKNKLVSFFLNVLIVIVPSLVFAQNSSMSLKSILSSKHPNITLESLISVAGSEDELVKQLLVLRSVSKPPMIGARAEKILLNFSDRLEVQSAIKSDVTNTEAYGLGSVVLSSLSEIKDSKFRDELIKLVESNLRQKSHTSDRYKKLLDEYKR